LKFLKIFTIVFLILLATVSGAALRVIEIIKPPSYVDPEPIPPISGDVLPVNDKLKIDPLTGTTTVLLVGLDELDGAYRADAVALAFFNMKGEIVGILSIPRDSRVQIQGRGWDKINHAYAFGGVNLLKQTLVNLTNVTICYFVVFNYDSFPRMVNLIGGVDLYVDKAMRYNDYSQKLFINIPQGQQHLDGKRSLDYVRFRHDPLGDIGRIQRQQKFISAALDKVKNPLILTQIPSLVREIVSAINTDLTPIEAIRLATFASMLKQGRIKFAMSPGKASYIGDISYWIIDTIQLSELVPKLIEGEEDVERYAADEAPLLDLNNETTMDLVAQIGKIGILNGAGVRGLARDASKIFQGIGIDVPFMGDARHFGYDWSSIVYPTEQDKRAAEALAQLCGITNRALIRRDTSANMVSIILGQDRETIFKRLQEKR